MRSPVKHHRTKFGNRLSIKLIAWVGSAMLLLFFAFAFIAIRMQEQQLIKHTLQASHSFSDLVKRATRFAMLKDQRESVHQIIDAIGKQPGVEFLRIFNKKGSIMFSSRKAETGHMVDMRGEACYGCHKADQPLERLTLSDRSRIFTTKGPRPHRVLGVINPIYTEPSCYTDPCHAHPPDQSVLGVLDVGLSLAHVDAEVATSTRRVIGAALFIFLAVTGVLVFFVFYFVNRPLSSLVRASAAIAAGDFEYQVPRLSDDEIGDLAQALDSMRQGIKERTEALDESRREFQTMFEQVPCYVSVQDRDLRLVAFNKMFDRDFHGRVGEHCYQVYKGRDSKCPNCAVAKSFADGRVHSAEEEVIGRDGTVRYFLNLTTPIVDRDGNINSVMEMATDVTALRTLEQELRLSEEKYRLFFHQGPNPMLVLDQRSLEIMDANQRAADEYLYSVHELIGRSFPELVDPADQSKVRRFIFNAEPLLPRVQITRKNGSRVYVNLRASYGEHLGRPAVIVTSADVTETMKAEQHLVQAAKMATLGEMSAGVAHELNQPLSVIATGTNVLRKQLKRQNTLDPATAAAVISEIMDQVERATRIINHLREFGRKAEVTRQRVSVNDSIEGVFNLLGQQLKVHDIAVRRELSSDLPPIWGDRNRLEQILINLILNARDALEEQRAGQASPGREDLITVRSFRDRETGRVVVTVSDNGPGMSQEVISRIFEPFFTTKEVGKGTGLGLSISYGIVRDYGGKIEVDSEPGRGTTFRLSFPPAGEDA